MRAVLLTFAASAALVVHAAETKGVDVELISANTRIAAGTPFLVGLKIHHHPGYHTYWQNPGSAGVPTEIQWELPPGFKAGAIRWPFPEQSMMAKYPVHGYERDVMLVVEITPPAAVAGPSVTLAAKASWMACFKGCYPGKADLKLTLPVSASITPDEARAAEFARAAKELPMPLEGWKATLESAKDEKEIRLRFAPVTPGSKVPAKVYFYSSDGQISSDQPQRLESDASGGFKLTLTRSEYSPADRSSLPGVLQTEVPLDPAGQPHVTIDPAYPAPVK